MFIFNDLFSYLLFISHRHIIRSQLRTTKMVQITLLGGNEPSVYVSSKSAGGRWRAYVDSYVLGLPTEYLPVTRDVDGRDSDGEGEGDENEQEEGGEDKEQQQRRNLHHASSKAKKARVFLKRYALPGFAVLFLAHANHAVFLILGAGTPTTDRGLFVDKGCVFRFVRGVIRWCMSMGARMCYGKRGGGRGKGRGRGGGRRNMWVGYYYKTWIKIKRL